MRLKSFSVQGFKNLTGPVTLGPLQSINVVHGANNAGKTNVLQAMDVFFRLLRAGNHVTKDQMASLEAEAQPAGYPFEAIFNHQAPSPIRWTIELAIDAAELEDAGIETNHATDHLAITLELSPGLGNAQLRVLQFVIGDKDVALKDADKDTALVGFAQSLRAHIARTYALETEKIGRPFVLLDTRARGADEGGLVPQSLRDALFDARQSLDRDDRRRWGLFVRLARELEPELGPGQFDTAFDRASGRADLIYDTGKDAVALEVLGSGVQKFLALLASLVLCRSPLVGLEEPELHLSYSLQQRLGRAMRAIAAEGGPEQFFLSSHCTALDTVENSFVLELQDGVLAMAQRSWQDSGAPPPPPPLPEPAQRTAEATPSTNGGAPTASSTPAAQSPDLDSLIGLVDQLSELEPGAITSHADAENGGKEPAGVANGKEENGQRVVDAAPWRAPSKK